MSISKCCRANVNYYHDGYFHEVSCSKCGQELADYEVIDDLSFAKGEDGDGEND